MKPLSGNLQLTVATLSIARRMFLGTAMLVILLPASVSGQGQPESTDPASAAERGKDLILNHPFLPRDFHQSLFDELWKDWPEPWRSQAEQASVDQRRTLAYQRYGFTQRDADDPRPLQYVVDEDGYWCMNCFGCHGGTVAGQSYAGLPNAQLAMETLYADIRRTKVRMEMPLGRMDLGALAVPMGTTVGTSNAVIFGIALMSYRDKDLNLKPFRLPPKLIHHDMDAPPWWNVSRRDRLYIDGFVQKNHRALVPFVMDQTNSGEQLREWEDKFRDVLSYIESLEPPRYPFNINQRLATQGKDVFRTNCAGCHGSCGGEANYPGKMVPLDEIGTDPVRMQALTPEHRQGYHESWFAHYGNDATVIEPVGYQAPPLNGIWATAPYFHNGSVPTLWHVLHPDERPAIWRRTDINGFDESRIGLQIEVLGQLPEALRGDQRREYFDTSVKGKSAAGHDYPNRLSPAEKEALLEYLKTL